ncbi:MAG: hypothetical protein RLY89_1975 [Bacteroidota bacterium]
MEVHHHSHHSGPKNWKSYLREFLMLFLAVFCGFLAEWRLEQMIENHREEEYIHSIVEDIKADIGQTEKLLIDMNSRIIRTDSLLSHLSSTEIKQNSSAAYKLWLQTLGFPDFAQNDRTIQQLKSSGSLRLIRNKAVSDKIMEYDQIVRLMSVTQTNMNSIAANNDLFNKTFNFIELNKVNPEAVPLTTNGVELLNQAYASRFFWKFNLLGYRQRLNVLNKKGKEVSEFIEKAYHLK